MVAFFISIQGGFMGVEGQVNTGDQGPNAAALAASQAEALGWRSALPDEYKQNDFVKTFTKPGDFVKSALEIKTERDSLKTKLDGAIPKLSENASPEEKAAFQKALGVPEKPEAYELAPLPPELKEIQAMEPWFRHQAKEAGLTVGQAKTLWGAYSQLATDSQRQSIEQRNKALTEGMDAIKKEWGSNYDNNLKVVSRAETKFGLPQDWVKSHNLDNDPALVKFLFNIGNAMLDDKVPIGQPPRGPEPKPGMTYKVPNPS
jgi:hypothetical protein